MTLTNRKIAAAKLVGKNWRIQKRLPRLTKLAKFLGFCKESVDTTNAAD